VKYQGWTITLHEAAPGWQFTARKPNASAGALDRIKALSAYATRADAIAAARDQIDRHDART